jgi:Rod binding domain-containing protein
MTRISPLAPGLDPAAARAATAPHPTGKTAPKVPAELSKLASEFEGIFVRQLLQSSEIIGKSAGGYGAMAVDALASGIEQGGGLGLAEHIEEALSRIADAHRPAQAPHPAPHPTRDATQVTENGSSTGRFVRSPR